MALHRETSLHNQQGTPCDCPIGRNHTIHDFYDLLDIPHPSSEQGALDYSDTYVGADPSLPWVTEDGRVIDRYFTKTVDKDGKLLDVSYTDARRDRA